MEIATFLPASLTGATPGAVWRLEGWTLGQSTVLLTLLLPLASAVSWSQHGDQCPGLHPEESLHSASLWPWFSAPWVRTIKQPSPKGGKVGNKPSGREPAGPT